MKKITLLFVILLLFTVSCSKSNTILKENEWVDISAEQIKTDFDDSNTKIIYQDSNYLVVAENKNVKTLRNSQNMPYDDYEDIAEEYIGKSNPPFLSILEFKNGKLTVAPIDYDADAKNNFKNYIKEIDTSDDFSFLFVEYKNDNGKETIECIQLSESDYENVGEFHDTGYVLFNPDGKIKSIIFYGEIIIDG